MHCFRDIRTKERFECWFVEAAALGDWLVRADQGWLV
jgi:hypothetical protein